MQVMTPYGKLVTRDPTERFWIKRKGGPWIEVSRRDFIREEETAGFHPKNPGEVATAGFSRGDLVKGRVTSGAIKDSNYESDPEFLAAAKASKGV